ncbi:hypothetical protein L218DRAFT_877378, partial [Marasmius fiardii PR-910]
LMEQLEKFAHVRNLIPKGQQFFSASPYEDLPDIICAWIMERCDSIDLDSGEVKLLEQEHSSFSHAQRMQAATTFGFGCIHGLDTQFEVSGKMMGNPSVSEKVSLYMISL